MAFTSWLRALNSHRGRPARKRVGKGKKGHSCLLQLEPLEQRLAPAQLVTDGGFETTPSNFNATLGSNSPWAIQGQHDAYLFVSGNGTAYGSSHSGTHFAVLAGYDPGIVDAIAQNIPTVAGQQYQFSFWLRTNGDASTHTHEFIAKFGNTTKLDNTSGAATGWTQYSYTVTASSSSTPVYFSGVIGDTFWALDDVSVTGVASTTTSLGPLRATSTYGDSVTLTAKVSVSNGSSIPSGTVTFKDTITNTVLGTSSLSSSGQASLTLTALAARKYTVEADYGGSSGYAPSISGTASHTVNKAPLTVTADNKSRFYGDENLPNFFTYTISGFKNGESLATSGVTGSPSLSTNATAASNVGTYTITAANGTLSAANYSFTPVNGTLTVTKAPVTVTANNASRVYGASNPTFTASYSGFKNGDTISALSGSPTLTTTATALSNVGSYPITAAQGTLSATNYSFTLVNGALNVVKADQTITWSNPAGITYGTALSLTQLNATVAGVGGGSAPGALTYSQPIGTILNASAAPQTLTVSAAAAANYNPATKTVQISVAKATPAITWSTLPDLTYGKPLGAAQLNASASHIVNSNSVAVAGTFTYTPPAGTVLAVGNGQTLSTSFAPSDTTNYNAASGSVLVNALPAVTISGTSPSLASGTVSAGTTSLQVTFSYPVLGGGTAANYELRRAGSDGGLGRNDVLVPLTVTYSGNTATLTFTGLVEDAYRLTVKDTITDAGGAPLDGNADGAAGESWSRDFLVGANVKGWGSNNYGQLGDGTLSSPTDPVAVSSLTNVVAVAGDSIHVLALRSDGTVWAWGYNGQGELGDGTLTNRGTPVQVIGLSNVVGIAAGAAHSLALRADGTVWAWGYNGSGQLGDGTTTDRITPIQIAGLNSVTAISAGHYYSVALLSDGTVRAWGDNGAGQLGDGTTIARSRPVTVSGFGNVIAVDAGGDHNLALSADGTVRAWGDNSQGQLGDGTTTSQSTPVAVSGLSGAIAISAGDGLHSLALLADGTVRAWGYNLHGELGDGTTSRRLTPVSVTGLSNVVGIGAGASHSLAVLTDGTVRAWGDNFTGQLSDGTTTNRSTPVVANGVNSVAAVIAVGYSSFARRQPAISVNARPVFSNVPANIGVEATGPQTVVTWTPPTVNDAEDGPLTPTSNLAPGTAFALGTTSVVYSATDSDGATSTARFNVTVADTTPPTLVNMPANLTVEATSLSGAVVTWTLPSVTDLVDPNPSVTGTQNRGTFFAVGTTTVSYTATDFSGNQSTASFTVTVRALPFVTFTVPTLANEGAQLTGSGSFSDPDAADVWSAVVNYGDGANGSLTLAADKTFSLLHTYVDNGTYTITVTVTDALGGSGTTSRTVQVNNVAPTPNILGAPANGPVGAPITLSATATDPSPLDTLVGFTFTWSVAKNNTTVATGTGTSFTFTPAGIGAYVVTLTAKDKNNASNSTTAVITAGTTYAVTGTVWNDQNANGRRDAGEPGQANQMVYIDLNWNAALDAGDLSTSTQADDPGTPADETGTYAFQLPSGTYTIRRIVPSGFGASAPSALPGVVPGEASERVVSVSAPIAGLDFGNFANRTITFLAGSSGTATQQTVGEGDRTIWLYAEISAPLGLDLAVPISVDGGTATAGKDFRLLDSSFIFLHDSRTASARLEILDDQRFEVNETLVLRFPTLTQGITVGTAATHTVTILNNDGMPKVAFDSPAHPNAQEGTTVLVTAKLWGETDLPVTVPVIFSDPALASQYTLSGPPTITIDPSSGFGFLSIAIKDDPDPDTAQPVVMKIDTDQVVNAVPFEDPLSQAFLTHTVTIPANDQPIVKFTKANVRKGEGDGSVRADLQLTEYPSPVDVTVTLSITESAEVRATDRTITVGDIFRPDSAVPTGTRTTLANGATTATITIPANSPIGTVASILINLLDDSDDEPDDTISFTITSVTPGFVVGTGNFMLTIEDNDVPGIRFGQMSRNEFWEDETTVTFTVTSSIAFGERTEVPIYVAASNSQTAAKTRTGYARAGDDGDFLLGTTTVTFDPNNPDPRVATGTVTIRNDADNELLSEQLTLELHDPGTQSRYQLGRTNTNQTLKILDDDPVVSINAPSPADFYEGGTANFSVSLDHKTNKKVTVKLVTGGTASRSDYAVDTNANVRLGAPFNGATTYFVDILPDSKSTAFTVHMTRDAQAEPKETVTFQMLEANAILASSKSATATILRNDAITISYDRADFAVNEYNTSLLTIPFKLSAASDFDVSVQPVFSPEGIPAVRKIDYDVFGLDAYGWLTIKAGDTSGSFQIQMRDDSVYQGDRSFRMKIGCVIGATSGSNSVYVYIVDNETPAAPPAPAPQPAPRSGLEAQPTSSLAIQPYPSAGPYDTPLSAKEIAAVSGLPADESRAYSVGQRAIGGASQGFLDGATAFFDGNFNGTLDFLDLNGDGLQDEGEPDEPSALTNKDGSFAILVPAEFDRDGSGVFETTEGRWVLTGGTDTATGLPWLSRLYAPVGEFVLTPLTSLVEQLGRGQGFSLADAEARVMDAFGLPPVQLGTFNPLAGMKDGDATSGRYFATHVGVYNTVIQIAQLFSGKSDGIPVDYFADLVYGELAARIADPETSADLVSTDTLADIIRSLGSSTGVVFSSEEVAGAAAVISAGNTAVAALPATYDVAHATAIVKVKKVFQGDAAAALHDVGAGVRSIAGVVGDFTQPNVQARIDSAEVGTIFPAVIGITDMQVGEGDAGTTILRFQVVMAGDHSDTVTVDYATADGAATAGIDYEAAAGTLTWLPGDSEAQTIQVTLLGDVDFEQDEVFRVVLSNGQNVVVRRPIGYGFILNDDAATFSTDAAPAGGNVFVARQGELSQSFVLNDAEISDGLFSQPLTYTVAGQDFVDDTFVLDFSAASYRADTINYYGGAGGTDAAEIQGGTFATITHTLLNAGDGRTTFLPLGPEGLITLNWFGLEPFTINSAAEHLVFQLPAGASVVLEDADPTDLELPGQMRLRSPDGQFETTVFANPTGSLTITGISAADQVVVASLDPAFTGTLVILPVNDPPLAVADSFTTDEDTPLTLTEDDLKANDTDPDNANGELTVTAVFNAAHGAVVLNADGAVTFTPEANFNGTAGFDYSLSDGEFSVVGHVTVLVNNVAPTALIAGAPADSPEGTAITLSAGVLDSAGDTHSFRWSVTKAGAPFAASDGSEFTFTPNDDGSYAVTLVVTDDVGAASAPATVAIAVGNVAPAATLSDSGPATYGDAVTVNLSGASDPSAADAAVGFHYAFSLDAGGLAAVTYATSGDAPSRAFRLPAGSYTVYARVLDKDDGYRQYETTVTVLPAVLTVTADDASRLYGDANPVLTATLSGFRNGETLATSGVTGAADLTTVATAASGAGAYAIDAAAGTLAAANYDFITFVAGTVTVTPAPLTVTANGRTKVYGAALPALTASYSGFVNGDTPASLTTPVVLQTDATAGSHVGTYAITAGGATSANYAITYADGGLSVTPAPLTITADDQVKVYGAALPALPASYAGFVNGDSAASLAVAPTLTTPATAASHVGAYAITAGGAAAGDYAIAYAPGTLTVTPALLTVTADSKARLYGEPNPAFTVSYVGFANGDGAAALSGAAELATDATLESSPGKYDITISAGSLAAQDYDLRFACGTLTVEKAATATAVSASAAAPLFGVDAVTFTAAVSVTAPGSGGPSGTVVFRDATTGAELGRMPLVGGIAALTTAALAPGGHDVTACYGGDGNFRGSAGAASLGVLAPASLSGLVYADFNDDGQVDFGERGLGGVAVRLTGTDDLGRAVERLVTTEPDGTYLFGLLRPGDYRLTEETQPAGYTQGANSVGTAGGSASAVDQFFVHLAAGVDGLNYNYGERPAATGAIQKGQTAGIGFWNNKNGQALIKSFNGGTGTRLGDWLAATLPNLFGANAGGNNLAGKGNAAVAALFQQDFVLKGVKLDAQLLATALSVYATNPTLDPTRSAAAYGFTVGGTGLGTATVNVGAAGAAFGVADNSSLTVLDLLLAADRQAVNGVLFNGNAAKRKLANDVFSALNEAGGIA